MFFQIIGHNISIDHQMWNLGTKEIFCPELVQLLSELHLKFDSRRKELIRNRWARQKKWNQGELPNYLDRNSQAAKGNWKIHEVPGDFRVRRVEITGPVNDTKMVINMLSRNAEGYRADTAMLDFEDSMKPSFRNVIDGYKNVIGASQGQLRKVTQNKVYELDAQDMAGLMVRVRGLHMEETHLRFNDDPLHAGMVDLAVCFFHTAKNLIQQNKTPKYYIPKCEHYEEARWWNDVFTEIETRLGYKTPTIRATFLIETLPAAFQIEEILYEGREHIIGCNVGRWDKIFSDIKVLREHKDRISADRSEIHMKKYWMDNYAKRLIKICHSRGAFAIGGMSAFTPGKDPQTREEQTAKVFSDKEYEASLGHDGCWVSHPYFLGPALRAFPRENQVDKTLEDFDKYPDLLMDGKGPRTLAGLRKNIRVGIAYMQGWLKDIGCVAWDNLMEDLATLEISRAQTWQWLHHQIKLDDGGYVTADLVSQIFEDEFKKISAEITQEYAADLPEQQRAEMIEDFRRGKKAAEKLFLEKNLSDFLTTHLES